MNRGEKRRKALLFLLGAPPTANELHFVAPTATLQRTSEVTVNRVVLSLALIVFITACESSTDPLLGIGGDGGGGAITQAQASGNWSFTVRKTTTLSCSGGSLADNSVLTAHTDVLVNGTIATSTSFWQNPPVTVIRPLSGAVRFSDGFADLFMFSSSANTSGMELRGTLTSTGTFTGTLTDPAPGFTPVFGTGGCEYTATGTKTG